MSNKTFLGIDIGTTSLKAAIFDEKGTRLGLRCFDYSLQTDPQTGFIEADPEIYVQMTERAIRELTEECGKPEALSVDTQGETMILTDAAGKPLYPAVVWLDNRAVAEADTVRETFGNKRVYEVTGQPEITAGWPATKMLWFRNHLPEVFEKTAKIFLLEDWILYRLTGAFVTEPAIQSSSVYFDISVRDWWQEMLDYIGIRREQLPRICESAETVGSYQNIAVVTGSLDQIAGMVGTGVFGKTEISEMTGTIMAICTMTDCIPPYRADSIIPCHLHAEKGQYCRILWSSTAGMALKWFREQFTPDMSFADIDRLAEKIPAGSDGLTVLPYFTGSTMPKYRPEATAVFEGVRLSHTPAHFARAIMESIAFLLRQDIEYIGGKDSVEEIRITGGGAKSRLWAQIKANVTGKRLCTVCESETACLGSAILAAVGVGAFPSIRTAAEKLVQVRDVYRPDKTDYTSAYEKFVSLDDKLNV